MDLNSQCIFSQLPGVFLTFPCCIHFPVILPSVPPPTSELNDEHKQIRIPCDSLCFKFRTSLGWLGLNVTPDHYTAVKAVGIPRPTVKTTGLQ